jgi:uncharacterized membrane protein YkvA (DUF1232 family)
MLAELKRRAKELKREMAAIWFCARHPRTPLVAKALAAAVVAYAFSPIDLIPDFIPVLGFIDDVILLPMGIWLVLRLIPPDVMVECRAQADAWLAQKGSRPRSYIGAAVIIALWLGALWLGWRWAQHWLAY